MSGRYHLTPRRLERYARRKGLRSLLDPVSACHFYHHCQHFGYVEPKGLGDPNSWYLLARIFDKHARDDGFPEKVLRSFHSCNGCGSPSKGWDEDVCPVLGERCPGTPEVCGWLMEAEQRRQEGLGYLDREAKG